MGITDYLSRHPSEKAPPDKWKEKETAVIALLSSLNQTKDRHLIPALERSVECWRQSNEKKALQQRMKNMIDAILTAKKGNHLLFPKEAIHMTSKLSELAQQLIRRIKSKEW